MTKKRQKTNKTAKSEKAQTFNPNILGISISLRWFLLLCNTFFLLLFFLIVLYLLNLQNQTTSLRSNLQIQGDVLRQIDQRILLYFVNSAKHLSQFSRLLERGIIQPDRDNFFTIGASIIEKEPGINALYFADNNGYFSMVKRIRRGEIIGQKIVLNDGNTITEQWNFPNGAKIPGYPELKTLSLEEGYDPRKQSWYQQAKKEQLFWFGPYPFFTDELVGLSGSIIISTPETTEGVLGIDIDVADLNRFLQELPFAKTGYIVIKDINNKLIAISDKDRKNYEILQIKFDRSSNQQTFGIRTVSELDSSPTMKFFSKEILNLSHAELEKNFTWQNNPLDQLLTIFFPADSKNQNIRNILLEGITFGSFPMGEERNYLFTYNTLDISENNSWEIYTFTDASNIGNSQDALSTIITWIFLGFAVILVIALQNISTMITHPLEKLSKMMDEFSKHLTLDKDFSNNSRIKICEIENIGLVYNNLQNGFRSFKKFVPDVIVHRSMSSGLVTQNKQEHFSGNMSKKTMAILFSDIEGFTSISECTKPEILCQCLDIYFSMMSQAIQNCNGVIDKFIGDAIMALFGAFRCPEDKDDHIAVQAISAALGMQNEAIQINQKIREIEPNVHIRTRIGISMGESMVGIIGSQHRLNFTALGDRVNLASRLEGSNKQYGTGIIVAEYPKELTDNIFLFRSLGSIQVRGKTTPEKIYEPIGWLNKIPEHKKAYYEHFNQLQAIVENQNFARSQEAIQLIMRNFPNFNDDPVLEKLRKEYNC